MGTSAGTVPVRGGLGGPLSLSVPSGQDGCFKGRRSKPLQEEAATNRVWCKLELHQKTCVSVYQSRIALLELLQSFCWKNEVAFSF